MIKTKKKVKINNLWFNNSKTIQLLPQQSSKSYKPPPQLHPPIIHHFTGIYKSFNIFKKKYIDGQ